MSYTRATIGIASGLVLSVVAVGAYAVGATRHTPAEPAQAMPVVYYPPSYVAAGPAAAASMPAVYQPHLASTPAYAPVAVNQAPAVRRVSSSPSTSTTAVRRKRAPSWQKRALIIGASAGAGAGVGALIGGKKGALIGAAAGGGGAAVVDLIRNR